jgi:hypothetical protein
MSVIAVTKTLLRTGRVSGGGIVAFIAAAVVDARAGSNQTGDIEPLGLQELSTCEVMYSGRRGLSRWGCWCS